MRPLSLPPIRPTVLAFLCLPMVLSAQEQAAAKRPLVEINTTAGRMVVALYNETPIHRDNFLKLVREHYYDSTLIHRVVPHFIIQGGDPDTKKADDRNMVLGRGGPNYTLAPEIVPALINSKGALCAGRQEVDVNPDKRSNGSQFFIVQGQPWSPSDLRAEELRKNEYDPAHDHMHTPDQVKTYATDGGSPHMDGEYTVFGHVVQGLDVIDHIAAMPVGMGERPLQDVRVWMRELP